MISKIISAVLVCVLLHSSVVAENQPQSTTQTVVTIQQVLHKAQERNKAVKVILRKKVVDNQRKFTSRVLEISDADFAIADQQSGQTMNFKYGEVQQVGQTGMSTGTIITIGALVVGAAIIIGLISTWLNNE